jgi:hypothetical protein
LRIAMRRYSVFLVMCDTPKSPYAPASTPTTLPGKIEACSRPSLYAPRAVPARRLAAHAQRISALRHEIHIQTDFTTPPFLPLSLPPFEPQPPGLCVRRASRYSSIEALFLCPSHCTRASCPCSLCLCAVCTTALPHRRALIAATRPRRTTSLLSCT